MSVIDIDAVLDQVRRAMDRAASAVQYVFLFTFAAGIVVLLAAIQATRDERMYESAVLRTLGAGKGVVFAGHCCRVHCDRRTGRAHWLPPGAGLIGYFLASETVRTGIPAESDAVDLRIGGWSRGCGSKSGTLAARFRRPGAAGFHVTANLAEFLRGRAERSTEYPPEVAPNRQPSD